MQHIPVGSDGFTVIVTVLVEVWVSTPKLVVTAGAVSTDVSVTVLSAFVCVNTAGKSIVCVDVTVATGIVVVTVIAP
jgi:hypothetical protein